MSVAPHATLCDAAVQLLLDEFTDLGPEDLSQMKFGFGVHGGKTHLFSASSMQQRTDWMDAIGSMLPADEDDEHDEQPIGVQVNEEEEEWADGEQADGADGEETATAQGLREEAVALFARADRDKNGVLSHSELKKEIQSDPELREKLSATKWKVFFGEIDSDGDGVITCEEFVAYYIKHSTGV